MRYALLTAAALLAACGQSEPPPPLPETTVQAVAAPWFICDAINAPVLLVFERDGHTARVAQYDKPNGALIQRTQYQIGDSEGAAGSIYTALSQNGAEAGGARRQPFGIAGRRDIAFGAFPKRFRAVSCLARCARRYDRARRLLRHRRSRTRHDIAPRDAGHHPG